MNACLLKHPIDIYELVTERTEFGTNEAAYKFKRKTRAFIQFNSETQVTSNGEIYYPTTRTFIVRTNNNVNERDRIFWDDKWWKIISINKNDYYGNIEIITEKVNT